MSLPCSYIQQWLRKPRAPGPTLDTQLKLTTSQILTYDKNFTYSPENIFGFAVILILSSKHRAANQLLSALFKVPEFSASSPGQIVALELWWKTLPESVRPEDTPWEKGRGVEDAERRYDLGRLEWWDGWTQFGANLKEGSDAHAWRESDDLITLLNCAKMLCQPKNKEVPSKEKVEETFACLDKFFTQSAVENHLIYFPGNNFFLLALYLGRKEKAVDIVKSASMGEPGQLFELDRFLDIPQLYDMIAVSEIFSLKFLEEDELVMVEEKLLAALNTRIEKGWIPALQDVSMGELLRRFSEAAFFVYKDEYVKRGIGSPKEILCGKRTAEEIAKVEETCGQLPQDLKEMALIADGFHGGWSFAGGGWGGIQKLGKDEYFDCGLYLGYHAAPAKEILTKTREDGSTYEVRELKVEVSPGRNDWEYVYSVYSVAECDNYVHILCPEEVWSKMQKAMGKEVKQGEYACMYYAPWMGPSGTIYSSVRDWIAQMTDNLERDMAAAKKAEYLVESLASF